MKNSTLDSSSSYKQSSSKSTRLTDTDHFYLLPNKSTPPNQISSYSYTTLRMQHYGSNIHTGEREARANPCGGAERSGHEIEPAGRESGRTLNPPWRRAELLHAAL